MHDGKTQVRNACGCVQKGATFQTVQAVNPEFDTIGRTQGIKVLGFVRDHLRHRVEDHMSLLEKIPMGFVCCVQSIVS